MTVDQMLRANIRWSVGNWRVLCWYMFKFTQTKTWTDDQVHNGLPFSACQQLSWLKLFFDFWLMMDHFSVYTETDRQKQTERGTMKHWMTLKISPSNGFLSPVVCTTTPFGASALHFLFVKSWIPRIVSKIRYSLTCFNFFSRGRPALHLSVSRVDSWKSLDQFADYYSSFLANPADAFVNGGTFVFCFCFYFGLGDEGFINQALYWGRIGQGTKRLSIIIPTRSALTSQSLRRNWFQAAK